MRRREWRRRWPVSTEQYRQCSRTGSTRRHSGAGYTRWHSGTGSTRRHSCAGSSRRHICTDSTRRHSCTGSSRRHSGAGSSRRHACTGWFTQRIFGIHLPRRFQQHSPRACCAARGCRVTEGDIHPSDQSGRTLWRRGWVGHGWVGRGWVVERGWEPGWGCARWGC